MDDLFSKEFLQHEDFQKRFGHIVQHGFGTRRENTSAKKTPKPVVLLKQTHSSHSVVVDEDFNFDEIKEGDALITKRSDVILAVKTADCLPVLYFDPVQSVVACVHAGWRGLVRGVHTKTLEKMTAQFDVQPQNVHVILGPCLQGSHFEVGPEVVDEFRKSYRESLIFKMLPTGKALIDMPKTAQHSLSILGVCSNNFYFMSENTFTNPEVFHSYRRDKDQAGRQLSYIAI